jgi:FkbM family methyltransferase
MNQQRRQKTFPDRVRSVLAPLAYIRKREWLKFLCYRRGMGRGEAVFYVKGLSHGLRVRAATTDAVTMESVFGSAYHLPPQRLRDDAVILDLGANAGYTAAHFATIYPKARVIALELDAANADLARRNLAPFKSCELVNAAIWIEDGEIEYAGEAEDGFAIVNGGGARRAPALTIQTLLDQRSIDRADYVKMDIEGAEWPMFQQTAWLDRIDSIGVEVHRPGWIDEIEAALRRGGFVTARSKDHWSLVTAHRGHRASTDLRAHGINATPQ